MNVLAVTLTVSLCLSGTFVAAYLINRLRGHDAGPNRETPPAMNSPGASVFARHSP